MPKEYAIQGDYGYDQGWEDLITEDDPKKAKDRLREYNENEPQYPHRIKAREVKES